MKISGRIILQKPGPLPVDLTRKELAKWMFGYFRAIDDAAKLATEADALMREMHSALQEYEACHNLAKNGPVAPDWDSARIQAQTALKHYQEYVK